MIFALSIIPSALFTAAYAYLFMYRRAALRVRIVQTALRFCVPLAPWRSYCGADVVSLAE